ncbi:sensor domain-containing protein [Halorubrum distributum]|uniref:sensor domain-containing protein n=1 Tax=Halorubrum distributum TaxID=29283 RepID=UPI0006781338|nr:sensor domain-containing protein [Halorubrum terrestre]
MALSDPVSNVSTTLPSVRQLLLVPFRLRTYGVILYLVLAFPLGIGYFVGTVVGLSLGISLSVFLVGLPILAATIGGVVLVAAGERVMARRLLGADVPAPSWGLSEASQLRDQVLTVLTNPVLWGSLIFVLSKLAVGVAAFTIVVVVLSLGLSLLAAPRYYNMPGTSVGFFLPEPIQRELSLVVPWEQFEVGLSFIVRLTSWEVSTLPGALLLSVLGVFVLLVGMNILTAGGWICARWAELTLSPGNAGE